jgi:predicted HTH domain antitoxin
MNAKIELEFPQELLRGLHLSAEELREEVKWRAAVALYKEGRLASGVAARWLGVARTVFLLEAMRQGAELLGDTGDDFARERALM